MDLSKIVRMPFFDKSADSAAGENVEEPEDSAGDGDQVTDPAGKVTFTPEQEKAIGKILSDARKAEREKQAKAAEAKAAKDKEVAEAERLKQEGKFKELAETAEKKALEAEARAQQALAETNRLKLQRLFEAEVAKGELEFVSAIAAEDAFLHLDPEAAGEDFKGLPAAVKKLVEERDYLFTEKERKVVTSNNDATAKGKINKTAVKKTIIDSKRRNYNPL